MSIRLFNSKVIITGEGKIANGKGCCCDGVTACNITDSCDPDVNFTRGNGSGFGLTANDAWNNVGTDIDSGICGDGAVLSIGRSDITQGIGSYSAFYFYGPYRFTLAGSPTGTGHVAGNIDLYTTNGGPLTFNSTVGSFSLSFGSIGAHDTVMGFNPGQPADPAGIGITSTRFLFLVVNDSGCP